MREIRKRRGRRRRHTGLYQRAKVEVKTGETCFDKVGNCAGGEKPGKGAINPIVPAAGPSTAR